MSLIKMMSVFLFIIFLIVIYIIYKRNKNCFAIPGPKGNILFGNSFLLSITDQVGNANTLSLLAKRYGTIFRLRVFGQNLVYLNSADVIRKALTESALEHSFSDRPPSVFSELLHYGGMVSQKDGNGHALKALRRHLAMGLHVFGEGVQKFEDAVMQELSRLSEKIEKFGGKEFSFDQVLTETLFNIISILLIGEPVPNKAMLESFGDFSNTSEKMLNTITSNLLMTFPFLRYISNKFKVIFDTHYKAVENIKKYYFYSMKETFIPGRTRGIVDFYLREQQKHKDMDIHSDESIQYIILDIIGASGTSKPTIGGLILCLMNHPDIQTRIQTELDAIVGIPKLSDKSSCPYTEAAIFETLRYLSIVPFLIPRTCKEDTLVDGVTIPKKSIVMVNGWYLWHNEEIWEDPWTFRPDRFLDQDGQVMPRSDMIRKGFIPFGLGRRRCPGEGLATSRIFLFLATILKQWTVLPPSDRKPSCDPRSCDFNVILSTAPKPFKCVMEKRNI